MIDNFELTPKKVTSVNAKGLLGQFDHYIEFPDQDEFVCIHGPNGVGKTRLLEMLDATLNCNLSVMADTPVERFTVRFDDSTVIDVKNQVTGGLDSSFDVELIIPEIGVHVTQTIRADSVRNAARWLANEGYIRRRPLRPGFVNVDQDTEELLSDDEAVARYLEYLPAKLTPISEWWLEIRRVAPTRLIEIGRLREVPVHPNSRTRLGDPENSVSALDVCSLGLADKIEAERANYSVKAQHTDRSYAIRLITEEPSFKKNSESEIRSKYDQVTQLQDRFSKLSLLGSQETSIQLPGGSMESWQRSAIGLHLADLEEKLSTFSSLALKMSAFQRIINDKLSGKRLDFDERKGFNVTLTTHRLAGTEIPLDSLSSGEKHLIVIMYRLLFEAEPGQLVLIDEPEISWHIGWQRQFLDDLVRLSEINHLRFIVATHSPQVVGHWTARMVLLGAAK